MCHCSRCLTRAVRRCSMCARPSQVSWSVLPSTAITHGTATFCRSVNGSPQPASESQASCRPRGSESSCVAPRRQLDHAVVCLGSKGTSTACHTHSTRPRTLSGRFERAQHGCRGLVRAERTGILARRPDWCHVRTWTIVQGAALHPSEDERVWRRRGGTHACFTRSCTGYSRLMRNCVAS